MHSRRTVALVGRRDEVAALGRVWRSVCEGDGPAGLLVQGPAGVGKSRLIEQAAASLVGPDAALVVGHCVDLYGHEMPYGGAADAVRDLIRRHGIDAARAWSGPFATALATLIPEIDPAVTEVGPSRLLEGFAALLDSAAADRPLWLWIEDLHWSDPGTRALVSWVMRTVHAPHLLVTCTLRTEEPATPYEVTDFWTELRKLPHVAALELRRSTAVRWPITGRRSRADARRRPWSTGFATSPAVSRSTPSSWPAPAGVSSGRCRPPSVNSRPLPWRGSGRTAGVWSRPRASRTAACRTTSCVPSWRPMPTSTPAWRKRLPPAS